MRSFVELVAFESVKAFLTSILQWHPNGTIIQASAPDGKTGHCGRRAQSSTDFIRSFFRYASFFTTASCLGLYSSTEDL